MARQRKYTEHLGLLVSVSEERLVKEYLKARKMTASEYFREVAIRPLLAAQAEVNRDGNLSVAAHEGL